MNAKFRVVPNLERIRQRLLLLSLVALGLAVFGYLAFAFRWAKPYRVLEVGALLSAPLYLCIGLVELVRYQRRWQVVLAVIISAIGCVFIYSTLSGYVRGLYGA